jgi:hypothetical protein
LEVATVRTSFSEVMALSSFADISSFYGDTDRPSFGGSFLEDDDRRFGPGLVGEVQALYWSDDASAETVDSPWLVFVAMDAVDVLIVVGVVFHDNSMIIVSLVVI